MKQVSVFDTQHHLLKSTYLKRAKQLVKNGRAQWISDDAIMILSLDCQEEMMTEATFDDMTALRGNGIPAAPEMDCAAPPRAKATLSDGELFRLAEQRYAQKQNLWKQARDSALILFCMALCSALYPDDAVGILACFALFWVSRLILRVVRFVRPTFYKGIGWYIRNYRKNKIESEYVKLKTLDVDQVRKEYENVYS